MHNTNRRCRHCIEKRSIHELHRSLRANLEQSNSQFSEGMRGLSQWQDWYDSSFISILYHNSAELDKDFNIRLDECLSSIAVGLPPEQRERIARKQKRDIQKTVASLIFQKLHIHGPSRSRQKLRRWMDEDAPGPNHLISAKRKYQARPSGRRTGPTVI